MIRLGQRHMQLQPALFADTASWSRTKNQQHLVNAFGYSNTCAVYGDGLIQSMWVCYGNIQRCGF